MIRKLFRERVISRWKIIEKETIDEIIFRTIKIRNRLMLELMARGGMRIGEVLKLTLNDIQDRKLFLNDPKSGKDHEIVLADSISENIITTIAKIPTMFVIARNSTFSYKGKPVKIQKIAQNLGVQYVLEGSVQRSEGKLRVTAQLIDAINGKHLWAEKYDRELKDIFVLQDEIAMKIITSLQVELTAGQVAKIWEKRANNIDAYLKLGEGWELYKKYTKEDNAQAQQRIKEALALDPEYSNAYTALGWAHMMDARLGWSKSRGKSMELAIECAQKARALDENNTAGSSLMAYIYRQQKQ